MDELGLPTSFGKRKRPFTKQNNYVPNYKYSSLSVPVDYDIDETFSKCFSFNSAKNLYKLPKSSSLFQDNKWMLQDFQKLKKDLNDTKSKLNNLNLKEWHLHTTHTNIAGDVMRKLRSSVKPEFLTQAWCKMYECLMLFRLVPKTFPNGVFNSVHLCEAPGAFITALNHFLQTWNPTIEWNWLATTLNPYHENNPLSHMIQDDRFILHTLPFWTFGDDGTGNLMDIDNLHHLEIQVQNRLQGNVMLVTADGSIDCQINPAEQEAIVAPLHYCETLAALSILQPGGSFMLKMFTLLECDSICLLYLLVCVFKNVNVFKPVKSKEGNSEVYVLCVEYLGKDYLQPWMPVLTEKFGPTITKAMFSIKDIPEEFISEVYVCAKKFTELQMRVIERNLDLFFYSAPEKLFYVQTTKRHVANRYIQAYMLKPVDKVIVGNDILADTPMFNLAQKFEEGTYNDRLRKTCLNPFEHTEQLWASVQNIGCEWPYKDPVCWFMVFKNRKLPPLEITFGQSVMTVCSSKFCNGRILEAYNEVLSANLITFPNDEIEITTTIDASQFPWDNCSSQCHYLLMKCLSRALQDLPVNKSLCIRGLPLLTQFSVAVVFLLAHSFFQVGLSVDGNIIFCGYRMACSSVEWIQRVLITMHNLPNDKSVLSILPISILCDQSYCMDDGTSFYMSVLSINNARLFLALNKEVHKIQQREKSLSTS